MKKYVKGRVINTRLLIKDNKTTFIFITLFTVGVALGSMSAGILSDKSKIIISVISKYFTENSDLSIMAIFSRNLISNFIYLGSVYLLGLCAIGLPIIAIIPTLKGIGLGAIISYQYAFNGLKGLLYSTVIIVIPSALFVALLNLAYTEGIYMSLSVSNGIFNGKPKENKYNCSFVTFTKRFILFSFFTIIISLIEGILTALFSKII